MKKLTRSSKKPAKKKKRSPAPTAKATTQTSKRKPAPSKPKPQSKPTPPRDRASAAYDAHRDRAAGRQREQSAAGRNIGPIPKPANPKRRAKCECDLALFLRTYQPAIFNLPFCADQLKAIKKIQDVHLDGGTNALGMPRGMGKTSICRGACLWGTSYGHRRFTVMIGATETRAAQSLFAIKRQVQNNELFAADFPEICYPISKLERITIRANGQLYTMDDGTIGYTDLTWGASELVLPTIEGSHASGAIVTCCGLTGDVLGQLYPVGDAFIRPDLVIIDDPQTFESANSSTQVADRERIILADVLGLAGPGKKIAAVMPLTVKAPGDLADRFLDSKTHPAWNGTRTKLVYAFPTNKELWDQYRNIRTTFDPEKDGDQKRAWGDATEFYREHREEMDAGAVVAWPERFDPDEISALQNATNILIDRGEEAFDSEYQNQPKKPIEDETTLTPAEIAKKLNNIPRRISPVTAPTLTAFIDCHKDLLYFGVCAWQEGFTGSVLDYGTWPEQPRTNFRLTEADPTIAMATKIPGEEGQLYAALGELTDKILGREWERQGGSAAKIGLCLIDAGYKSDVVYQFCRQSPHAAILRPSHGKGIGAKGKPMAMWAKKDGEIYGLEWVDGRSAKRAIRYVMYETNFWKSFVHARLAVAMGNAGCLALFGDDSRAHRMLADHLTGERPVKVEAEGRKAIEWVAKPNQDNHLFDCLVGAAVAGSRLGVALGVHATGGKKRVRFSEIYAAAQSKQ